MVEQHSKDRATVMINESTFSLIEADTRQGARALVLDLQLTQSGNLRLRNP
jgi:hypothetical protein